MIKASDLFEKYKYKKVQHEDGSFGYIVGYDDEYNRTDYAEYDSLHRTGCAGYRDWETDRKSVV